MLNREIIAVCFQIHKKTLTLCGQNVECRRYRAVNTLRLSYKTNQLILYREIIAICSQIHKKHINTLCGQNVELLKVKNLVVHIVTNGLSHDSNNLTLPTGVIYVYK
jgi:hypothetical protein